ATAASRGLSVVETDSICRRRAGGGGAGGDGGGRRRRRRRAGAGLRGALRAGAAALWARFARGNGRPLAGGRGAARGRVAPLARRGRGRLRRGGDERCAGSGGL